MPLTRYQIRNEYSLADPELYRAADKDDPEALLEGVAMAGLVGVLRQLGDLAEFAAEIFHDLHEEVMATAARGHGLMVRVQQLETDFPSIEKAFLSQTSPSLFFYDPGVDWHPNLRIDQNLITQGDLPRFVMDSYEECRGPPRLFLLDKFDVAGAGACLKRYTDPSFFKVDSSSSGMTKAEVHREKKTRKAKKKVPRWRNGETPEVTPISHAKLHQLFLEESVENYIADPARRVKLKRRLNGFPFDSKTGISFMEKFLKNPTPDHNVRDISVNSSPLRLPSNSNDESETPDHNVRDISVNSSPLRLPSNTNHESGIQILEISTVNPGKELPWRKRRPWSSPDAEKTRQNPSIDELNEEVDYGISEVPNPSHISEAVNDDEDVDEKGMTVNRERKMEGSVDSYQSDDIASEVENYMDALTNMDSEMETDTEWRAKNDLHRWNTDNLGMNSDANVEVQDLQAHFSDSQSIENSTATDDENSSSRKGLSSFSYSDSLSNSAENAPSDGDVSANFLPSTGSREAESVSSDQAAERMVSNGVFTEDSSFSLSDSTILPVNSGKISTEGESIGLESDKIYPEGDKLNTGYLNREENTSYLGDNIPCTSNCSDSPSQTRYDFLPGLSSENHFVHELANEDSHVLSHSFGKKISENPPENAFQAEYGEVECPKISVDDQIGSAHSVTSELETWYPDTKPDGVVSEADDIPPLSRKRKISSIPIENSSQATDITKQKFPGISETEPSLELDSADVGSPYHGEENLDKAPNAADAEEMDASPHETHLIVEDAADLELPSDLQNSPDPPPVPDVCLNDAATETVHSEAVLVDEAVASTYFECNGGEGKALSGSPTKLPEESNSIVQDLCVNVNEPCSQEHLQESGSQGVASSYLDSILLRTVSCDESNSEVLDNVSDSAMAAPSRSLQQTFHSEGVLVDEAVAHPYYDCNGGEGKALSGSPTKLQEESVSILQDLCVNGMEINEPCSQEHLQEFGTEKEAGQQGVALSFLDSDLFSTVPCDESNSEVLNSVPDSTMAAPSRSLQIVDATTVSLSSDQHDQQSELKSAQAGNLIEDTQDDQKVELRDNQFDVASCCGKDDVPTVYELPRNILQTLDASTVPQSSDPYDQLSESKYAKQINIVEDAEDDVSSYDCHIAELRPPLEQKSDLKDDQYDGASGCGQDSESKSSNEIIVFQNAEDAASSRNHNIVELKAPVEQKVEQDDRFDVESLNPDKARSESMMELIQSPNQVDASSELCVAHLPREPSVVELLPQVNVSNNAKELSFSALPSFGQLPELPQINLDEMPPLPPLPPMQWRIGKVQHASLTSKRDLGGRNRDLFPPMLMSTADDNTQLGHLATADVIAQPSNPFLQLSGSEGKNSHSHENSAGYAVHSNPLSLQVSNVEHDIPTSDRPQSTNPFLVPPTICGVRSEHGSGASEEERAQPSTNAFSPATTIQDAVSANPPKVLPEELNHPLPQSASERSLEDEKLQGTSVVPEGKAMNPLETTFPPPMLQVDQPHTVSSPSEEQIVWSMSMSTPLPPSEDGNQNGNRQTKLPRPRNPLIDAVVAHDKSKLRKVTERTQSNVGEKIEERDSLLEQIRTKSFNLRPAALTRPSIQGPKTNFKVAAILEKANAIRQAFAGSDEDDDADNWSDS
ncbi:hypothetical protein Vadar_017689 [Vaccinium darrowii]|uniref:Uncharacterized protein n=1 Tax=Vaccinium darrowii TaxID=229202 RepID=A0ACB7ZK61_9ERIC|nr:hypothetical protein Vadar_017689 [Vaccinium darrowii]